MRQDDLFRPLEIRRARISNLGNKLKTLRDMQQAIAREIEDYEAFIPLVEKQKLQDLEAKVPKLSHQIATVDEERKKLERKIENISSTQVSPVVFWGYFRHGQRELRSETKRLKKELSAVEVRLKFNRDSLIRTRNEIDTTKTQISWHEAFDLLVASQRFSSAEAEIRRAKEDREALQEELVKLEEKIHPHKQEYDRLMSDLASAKSDVVAAQDLDEELSKAPNSYERAMIHEECQSRFGAGSPRKIISDRNWKIRRLENNIPKLERRIRGELQKSERVISHLLIDGNNVCYEGQAFIGLRAISTLISALSDRIRVTVVFDASIRSMLRTDTQGIEGKLGSSVTAHVAPTRTAADEYILKMAGQDKQTFILSNDRYAEYHDYHAVKSCRILRFLIADGKIMANDLDIALSIHN